MPKRSDDPPRINGARLCEITGVHRQTRDKWADEGLVRRAETYDQIDVLEVAVLRLLLATLRKKHAKIAWAQIRPQLRDLMPGPQLTLVWDRERLLAALTFEVDSIVELVRHGRPVQVLDLGAAVEHVRAAFRRDAEAAAAAKAAAAARRRRRTAQRNPQQSSS